VEEDQENKEMLVELITHCWAHDLPHFAKALCYKLSSLILHPPKTCQVQVTVCYWPQDMNTREVIEWYYSEYGTKAQFPYLRMMPLTVPSLGRRCIGRNIAAKNSAGDIVWFDDVDQVYRDGVLDLLAAYEWSDDVVMVFPKQIQIHRDHHLGDRCLFRIREPQLVDTDPGEFINKRYNVAIGGVQIVRGDFARRHGYLDGNERWQQKRTDGRPFGDFRDDLAYRGFCKLYGRIQGIDLPGMYRLRHTRTTHD
jgi:hypothetical protein